MLDSRVSVDARSVVASYIRITKPRIIELLLVTTVPVMMLTADGWPSTWLVIATVLGGSLSAGGANVLNNVCDRDIDQLMDRTADRPLVTEEISPRSAFVFGVVLGLVGHVSLSIFVGQLAAWLSTGSLLFYVCIYTLLLKRRTVQNIVIGGAAGAIPVLVGSAAINGTLTFESVLLFVVVCLWTPPHFWALAIRYRADYAKAAVPMLPVVAGVPATIRQIRIYTVLTVVASLALGFGSVVSLAYLLPAAVVGIWFLRGAILITEDRSMAFFRDSILYLTVLFGAVAFDSFV